MNETEVNEMEQWYIWKTCRTTATIEAFLEEIKEFPFFLLFRICAKKCKKQFQNPSKLYSPCLFETVLRGMFR